MRRAAVVALLLGACGPAASSDPGLDALLRVRGAQAVEGPLPAPSGGPELRLVDIPRRRVRAGEAGHALSGRAGPGSFAVHLGLAGDVVHWRLPVGLPDELIEDERDWSAPFDLSAALRPGPITLELAASDAEGRLGARRTTALSVVEDPVDTPLLVTLSWRAAADLDLVVVTPSGVVIGPKNVNGYTPPAPGQPPPPPEAWRDGAVIDVDSNAGCAIDGHQRERLIGGPRPESGRWRVYVDLASACGVPSVGWRLEIRRDDVVVEQVVGTAWPVDARVHPSPPGGAPGRLAAEVELP